jgi:hypothetical protein
MITFKNLLLKLRESSNSASGQGLGISGSEGKSPGSVSAKMIMTPKITTTTQVKTSNTKSKEGDDTEDMWYVKDNLLYTKKLSKQTIERVKNHHK